MIFKLFQFKCSKQSYRKKLYDWCVFKRASLLLGMHGVPALWARLPPYLDQKMSCLMLWTQSDFKNIAITAKIFKEICKTCQFFIKFPTNIGKIILFLAVMEAIPTIVCDTLYTLGLHDQIPSWKIMDNKGRITVVLHWEPEDVAALRSSSLPAIAGPSRQSSTCSTIASGGPRLLGIHARSISQVRSWDEFNWRNPVV